MVDASTTSAALAIDDGLDADGRPTRRLPVPQLLQISLYWFGISAIWGGWSIIGPARLDDLVGTDAAGRAYAAIGVIGAFIALAVQPTVGSISDFTTSRWGRRKPYIAIGASLDLLFLIGLASSQTYLSVIAFVLLLQFSSNFAQGPFQGYVPDLVPEPQVNVASGLMGIMSVFGVIGGVAIAAAGLAESDFFVPTIALGFIELTLAIATVIFVREGRRAKPREGRSWFRIAAETWGTDILQERSYVWLLASRLCLLMAAGILPNVIVWYMERSLGIAKSDERTWIIAATAIVGVMTLLSAMPAALMAGRVGRKTVIYTSALTGAVGMTAFALAPEIPIALAGAIFIGIGSGAFLSVDWALMTSIIPKASSGRYMGMSNVATALGTTALPIVVGGLVADHFVQAGDPAAGPRVALLVAVGLYGLGSLLLRPVREPPPSRQLAQLRRSTAQV
jgi:MFS family permease